MPTYQYSCTECGHFLEAFQSFSDDSLTECPECAGRLRKVFNAVGVVFKGSGFYRNDSRGAEKTTDSSDGSTEKSTSTEKADKPSNKGADKGAAEKPAAKAASSTSGDSGSSSNKTEARSA